MLRTNYVHQLRLPKNPLRHLPSRPQTNHSHDPSPVPRRFRVEPLLVSAFLCLSGIGVYMWPRVQSVRLAYQLPAAEQRLKDLLQEHDHLRLELAALTDPQRVYKIATERLGMITPKHDQVFILMRGPQGR